MGKNGQFWHKKWIVFCNFGIFERNKFRNILEISLATFRELTKNLHPCLNRYSGSQWFMSHSRGSSDLDQTWSMWSVDIPKKAHWVKKIFFFPPKPPGGAQFFYYMEIEAAVLAMFEHESNFFFFFAWRGTKNSPDINWKKFGSGPFLIRLVHLLLKSTYIQHGPTGWRK